MVRCVSMLSKKSLQAIVIKFCYIMGARAAFPEGNLFAVAGMLYFVPVNEKSQLLACLFYT